MSSYQPPTSFRYRPSVHPTRDSLVLPKPLPTPPTSRPTSFPDLPSPVRASQINNYALSTHVLPSPRSRISPRVPLPDASAPPLSLNASKAERDAQYSRIAKEVAETNRKHYAGQYDDCSHDMELWNCVNRHVLQKSPKEGHDSRGKRITLILAHANGFPKEIWEPTLQSLISHSESADYIIEEIWSWEAVQHGDSALINAKALSGVHDWADNSRDILNFLINYMPSAGSDESLPTHLNPVEPSVSAFRAKSGFSDRTLVAIGHSYGGTTSAFAALTHPWLFSAIILIDPIINPASDYGEKYVHHLVAGAIKRRNGWSSRAEALEQFKRIPFFAAWEPAVLQRYIDFGLYEDRKGQFQLKMTPIQEAVAFVETRLSAKVWDLMPLLDEQVALHWVKPARLLSIPGLRTKEESEKIAQELVWLRPANASNTILPTGHLVPHESPSSLAQDLHLFLVKKYGRSVRYHSNAKL